MELIKEYKEKYGHVHNLRTIDQLEELGFVGLDNSLTISLEEYGLAWCKHDNEITFIYCITMGDIEENMANHRFDRTTAIAEDVFAEYNWVKWDEFCGTSGLTEEEFREMPYELQVAELFQQYGYENIFGSSYWEGFRISEYCDVPECHGKCDGAYLAHCEDKHKSPSIVLCDCHAKWLGSLINLERL